MKKTDYYIETGDYSSRRILHLNQGQRPRTSLMKELIIGKNTQQTYRGVRFLPHPDGRC